MSEEFEHEVLGRLPLDRRAFIKKVVVGAAFAAPLIASFNMVGLGAGSAHGLTSNTRCAVLENELNNLQNELANLPPGAPAALRTRIQKRISALEANIIAHC